MRLRSPAGPLLAGLLMVPAIAAEAEPREAAPDRQLHLNARLHELRVRPEAEISTVAAYRFLERITAPASQPAQIHIEQMAEHAERFAPDGGLTLLPALTAAWLRHEPAAEPLSTLEILRQEGVQRTFESLSAAPDCCPCISASTCGDSLFCNGGEICSNSICAIGPTPCVDGDACTIDRCNEGSDTCSFPPVPPPDEVARIDLDRDDPTSAVTVVSWSDVVDAESYNVYRGEVPELSDLVCYAYAVPATVLLDEGAVSPDLLVYLVTSVACGESSLDNAYNRPRPTPPPCP